MSLNKNSYSNFNGLREVTVHDALTVPNAVTIKVFNVESGKNEGATLKRNAAIALARDILQRIAPDALAPAKFSETPVGTYLLHKKSGVIVKVVEYSDDVFGSAGYSQGGQGDDTVWSVTSDGRAYPAWQDSQNPGWEVVEVEETSFWKVKK